MHAKYATRITAPIALAQHIYQLSRLVAGDRAQCVDGVEEAEHERLSTVTIPPGGRKVGRTLGSVALEAMGVRVASLRRAGGRNAAFDDDTVLDGGDTLVLSGKAPALALAEEKLLGG